MSVNDSDDERSMRKFACIRLGGTAVLGIGMLLSLILIGLDPVDLRLFVATSVVTITGGLVMIFAWVLERIMDPRFKNTFVAELMRIARSRGSNFPG